MAKVIQKIKFDEDLEKDLRVLLLVRNEARGERLGYSPFIEEIVRGYVDNITCKVRKNGVTEFKKEAKDGEGGVANGRQASAREYVDAGVGWREGVDVGTGAVKEVGRDSDGGSLCVSKSVRSGASLFER